MNKKNRIVKGILIMTAVGLLSSCAQINKTFDNKTTHYQQSNSIKSLEVPPDLSSPEYDKTFVFKSRGGQRSVPTPAPAPHSVGVRRVSTANLASNAPKLMIRDKYKRTWARTGVALRRIGFTLEGQNEAKGLYAALWGKDAPRGNQLTRLIESQKAYLPKGTQIVVQVKAMGSTTELRLLDNTGKALPAIHAKKVLASLREALN
ncbi:MAG: outer membrane protein assembly factor BamC [Thiotrichaceae bacterium]|nr:outer membrane protein assembly factor BamC [Thiotrichaceae bacterium]